MENSKRMLYKLRNYVLVNGKFVSKDMVVAHFRKEKLFFYALVKLT